MAKLSNITEVVFRKSLVIHFTVFGNIISNSFLEPGGNSLLILLGRNHVNQFMPEDLIKIRFINFGSQKNFVLAAERHGNSRRTCTMYFFKSKLIRIPS